MHVAVLELPTEKAWGVQVDGVRIGGVVRQYPESGNFWRATLNTETRGDTWVGQFWRSREAAAYELLSYTYEAEATQIAYRMGHEELAANVRDEDLAPNHEEDDD